MERPLVENIALLVVGWLLGLLAPAFVDAIRRRRENMLGRRAILSELNELGSTLALAAYGVRMGQGKIDKQFLEWLKVDIEHFSTTLELQNMVPRLKSMISLTDSALHTLNQVMSKDSKKGTMLQHYSASLLDSRVSALWSFETSFQRQLLEIKHHLSLLDDLVERSRKYFDLTFTKLEGANYRLVQENLDQACEEYAHRAELLVGKIRTLHGNAQFRRSGRAERNPTQ